MTGNNAAVAPDLELDGWLERFETEAGRGAAPDPADFLPDPSHPKYPAALRELLRLDLEFAWSRGTGRRIEDYASRFPSLFRDPAALAEVALEEYRQRRAAGEHPASAEYRQRFGIDLPLGTVPAADVPAPGPFWDGHRLPEVGEVIPPGYRVVAEIGRGAFGRVYLAEQADLANRKVAVKISSRLIGEAQTLARLQHTHIVPVYAVHRVREYQVLVMPYLGGTTLADVLSAGRAGHSNRPTERPIRTAVAARPVDGGPASVRQDAGPVAAARPALWFGEDEVIAIGIAVADGLAHAHDRGILHRDVKPANILLTEDGRPMLLDFNLAADRQEEAPAAGGTPRYMAPEQFEALTDPAVRVDARADVYALGVVLHELFTGRAPFPDRTGPWSEVGPTMLADRRQLPDVRYHSPAVAAILRTCLQPDPSRRYGSAADLRDDLARHRDHRPLRVAPEPLSAERVRKWARRHPRLSSVTSVVTAAAVVIALIGWASLAAWRGNQEYRAREARAGVAQARQVVDALVVDPGAPDESLREGRQRALESLAGYNLPADEDWLRTANARRLSPAEVEPLRADVAALLYCAAVATGRLAGRETESAARDALYEEALLLNARAGAAFPADGPVAPILAQRVRLLELRGRADEAAFAARGLKQATTPGPVGQFLLAHGHMQDGRFREAAAILDGLAARGPASYQVWMALGTARLRSHQYDSAADAFLAAGAIEPGSPWPLFYRGAALLSAGRYEQSAAALDQFIERRPTVPDAWLNRAVARQRLNDPTAAIADLAEAARLGGSPTRVHGLSERAWRAAGRRDRADEEHRLMLTAVPRDVDDWTIRGEGRLAEEPAAAVSDFDAALALEPGHAPALRGKASALAERLNRPADAAEVLGRLVETGAATIEDRAGLAVLFARLNRPADAHEQARACLGRGVPALPLYQAASALALTARTPADRAEVLDILRRVIQNDASWARHMPADPDLRAVHAEPGFKALMDAARTLTQSARKDDPR